LLNETLFHNGGQARSLCGLPERWKKSFRDDCIYMSRFGTQ
jgi:hypothetical protein